MKKLALLAVIAILAAALCVSYINKPDPIDEKIQDVPTQVVRVEDIVERPSVPTKNINTYGGVAYDFENLNPIKIN